MRIYCLFGKKVLVFLRGGLGNQLFQFFAAWHFSNASSKSIVLDCSPYYLEESQPDMDFELHNLPYLPIYQKVKVKKLAIIVKRLNTWKLTRRVFAIHNDDDYLSEVKSRVKMLYGFFQVKDRIWASRFEIASFLRLTFEKEREVKELCKNLKSSNSIVIHIRLGDYLSLSEFPILSPSFIRNAIEASLSIVENGKCYYVTDSPGEAIKLYGSIFDEYKLNLIDTEKLSAIELVHLLSQFKCLILSKSSLSWWAGFFGSLHGNRIFAPFTIDESKRGNFHPNQALDDWICLENFERFG